MAERRSRQWTAGCTSSERSNEFTIESYLSGRLGGRLGGKFGKRGKKFGKEGAKYGKLGGRPSTASTLRWECSLCSRSLLREKFWACDWRKRKLKSIVCKECCPSEPRQRHITAASQARAIRVVGTPITCKVCQNTRPRSQFRPDASGRYRISEGLTCEPCRAEGKLNKGGRKRLSEVTRSGTTGGSADLVQE